MQAILISAHLPWLMGLLICYAIGGVFIDKWLKKDLFWLTYTLLLTELFLVFAWMSNFYFDYFFQGMKINLLVMFLMAIVGWFLRKRNSLLQWISGALILLSLLML